jgi:hypothetical protein
MFMAAMADSAREDGYISGNGHGSMNHMTRKCNFGSKQTTIDARDECIAIGELLCRTPADRGNGRYFEYVLVMGRDINQLAATFGWKPPLPRKEDRSTGQTASEDEAATSTSDVRHRPDTMEPATVRDGVHRDAETAPSASTEQVTEPVDDALSAPSDERSSGQTEDGPGMVRYRSDLQRHSRIAVVPTTPTSQVAHGPERGCARDAVETVDNVLLAELRDALAELAPSTTWRMTRKGQTQLLVHAAAWPDPHAAVDAFVAASHAMVDQYGPPDFTNAWLPAWLGTTPPAIDPAEPMCEEHPLGDYPVPKRACAICRTTAIATDQAAAQ